MVPLLHVVPAARSIGTAQPKLQMPNWVEPTHRTVPSGWPLHGIVHSAKTTVPPLLFMVPGAPMKPKLLELLAGLEPVEACEDVDEDAEPLDVFEAAMEA